MIEDLIEFASKEGGLGGVYEATITHDPACAAPEGRCSCGAKHKIKKIVSFDGPEPDDHDDHECDDDCQREAISFGRWFLGKYEEAVARGTPAGPHAAIMTDAIRKLLDTDSAAMGMHLACMMLVCHPDNVAYQQAMIQAMSGCPSVHQMIRSYMRETGQDI